VCACARSAVYSRFALLPMMGQGGSRGGNPELGVTVYSVSAMSILAGKEGVGQAGRGGGGLIPICKESCSIGEFECWLG
jgi:hypothetical protein